MSKMVRIDNREVLLFDAILELGSIRSELSQMNDLVDGGTGLSRFSLMGDDEGKRHIPITQVELESKIQER